MLRLKKIIFFYKKYLKGEQKNYFHYDSILVGR